MKSGAERRATHQEKIHRRNQYIYVFGVLGIGGAILAAVISMSSQPPMPENTAHGEIIAYHHAMLDYYYNGQKQIVPANIGIGVAHPAGPSGMYPVHTHDASGTIHIESKSADLRLSFAEFVELWGLDLSDKRYSLFVNGALVDYSQYYFNDGDRLRLEVVSYEL